LHRKGGPAVVTQRPDGVREEKYYRDVRFGEEAAARRDSGVPGVTVRTFVRKESDNAGGRDLGASLPAERDRRRRTAPVWTHVLMRAHLHPESGACRSVSQARG
jgi:hypothetical protein